MLKLVSVEPKNFMLEYGQWTSVLGTYDFTVKVLDTDDLTVEKSSAKEIRKILKSCSISIEGIRTNSRGDVVSLFVGGVSDTFIKGDFAILYRQSSDKYGNYCDCELIKRGIGTIFTFRTPSIMYDTWSFDLKFKGKEIAILSCLVNRNTRKPDAYTRILVRDNGTQIAECIHMPTPEEIRRLY